MRFDELSPVDQVLYHRYMYYVLDSPCISDPEYDRLERRLSAQQVEELGVGSSLASSYPTHIRKLADPQYSGITYEDIELDRPPSWVQRSETDDSWWRYGMVGRAWLYLWYLSEIEPFKPMEYKGLMDALDTLNLADLALELEADAVPLVEVPPPSPLRAFESEY